MRFADEKARLDNFAIELTQRRGANGYIVVYSGEAISAAQARERAKRAKRYLVRVRRINASRLVTLYGEPIGQFTIELYIVPKGAQLLQPSFIPFLRTIQKSLDSSTSRKSQSPELARKSRRRAHFKVALDRFDVEAMKTFVGVS